VINVVVTRIRKDYVPLGEGKGISITLLLTSLVLERREKKEGKWQITEKITLAPKLLECLFARIPQYIAFMEAHQKKNP
jgi:hypothetical protein